MEKFFDGNTVREMQATLHRLESKSSPSRPAKEVYDCSHCRDLGWELTDQGAKPCRHIEAVRRARRLAALPEEYRGFSLETIAPLPEKHPNYHTKQAEAIAQMQANPYLSYLLCGTYGTGKTLYGNLLYRRALEEERPAISLTLSELLHQYRQWATGGAEPSLSAELVRRHRARLFVLIDEFGKTAGRVTEFASGSLHTLVQACYEHHTQLVITANKNKNELQRFWSQADPEYGPAIMRKVLQKQGAFLIEMF
jgi:DNA replication protein DnaC